MRNQQRNDYQHAGRNEIWPHQAGKTYASTQYGNDLCMLSQSAREPDDGEEHNEAAQQIAKMEAETQVVHQSTSQGGIIG